MKREFKAILTFALVAIINGVSLAQGSFDTYGFCSYDIYEKSSKSSPNSYAVIINGGCSKQKNYVQYWNNCARTYQYLTNVKGFSKSNIYVAMADGLSNDAETIVYDDTITSQVRTDSNLTMSVEKDSDTGWRRRYYINASHSLDGKGVTPNLYEANITNIRSIFEQLSAKSNIDELFIFVTDHGYTGAKSIALWNYGNLTHASFRNMINGVESNYKTILLAECYSGSYIEYLKGENRTICTATSADSSSWGGRFSCFFDKFYDALYGKQFGTGYVIDADYNGDGVVSTEEAFVYAKDHDANSMPIYASESWYEIPRYWSSDTDYRFCRDTDWGVFNQINSINCQAEIEAMYLLNASNIVNNRMGGEVVYRSGKYIRLKKGFHVINGKFRTEKIDCEYEKQQNEAELRKLALLGDDEDYLWDEADNQGERETSKILFYPNPTDGIFNISFGSLDGEKTVVVTNMSGEVVCQGSFDGEYAEVDLSGNNQGVYFVKITTSNKVVVNKMILK